MNLILIKMLSNIKINKVAEERFPIVAVADDPPSFDKYFQIGMHRGFIGGATWTSEQYAGVIEAAEHLTRLLGGKLDFLQTALPSTYADAWSSLYQELNKLKQP